MARRNNNTAEPSAQEQTGVELTSENVFGSDVEAGGVATEDFATAKDTGSTTSSSTTEKANPSSDSAPASEPKLVTLYYDGEIPSASFPVMTNTGWVYIPATKGTSTAPLAEKVAAQLLKSGKGFTLRRSAESKEGVTS